MIHLAYYARVLGSLVVASFLSATASYLALAPSASSTLDTRSSRTDAPESTSEAKQKQQEVNQVARHPGDLGDSLGHIGPVLSCGRKKCLYEIVSPRNDQLKEDKILQQNIDKGMNKGYLISNGDSQQYQRAYDSWRYAKYLEHHYGMNQTLLDKPIRAHLSEDIVRNHLNADASRMRYKNRPRRFEAGSFTLQPVRIVSQPNILLGCYSRYKKSIKKLGRFISQVKTDARERGKDISAEQFTNNILHDLNRAKIIMQEDEVECLYHDFQVMLDANGDLHHIDLDRCLAQVRSREEGKGKIRSKEKAQCMQDMHEIVEEIRNRWDD